MLLLNDSLTGDSRSYPKSGIFTVCKPDVPCITPGTYAFLGAAAALRLVVYISPSELATDLFAVV